MSSIDEINKEFNEKVRNLNNLYRYHYNNILHSGRSYREKRRLINSLIEHCRRLYTNYVRERDNKIKDYNARIEVVNNSQSNLKALMVGINYENTSHELRGCINDLESLREYLISNNGLVWPDEICSLTDRTIIKPTRETILEKYKKLLKESKPGDTLFFTYSGHGSYTLDLNNDELDGRDEVLVCIDNKGITDDELKEITQNNLKENVNIFILLDCCHSGTLMDLKYNYLSSDDYSKIVVNDKNSESKGNIYLISGCKDNQTSADAYINREFQGAMSWAFLKTVKEKKDISWKELLLKMRELLKPYFTQIPQLSSGRTLDINSKIII